MWPTLCRLSAVRLLSLSHCFSLRLAMLFDFPCWVCSRLLLLLGMLLTSPAVGYALLILLCLLLAILFFTFSACRSLSSLNSFHHFSLLDDERCFCERIVAFNFSFAESSGRSALLCVSLGFGPPSTVVHFVVALGHHWRCWLWLFVCSLSVVLCSS